MAEELGLLSSPARVLEEISVDSRGTRDPHVIEPRTEGQRHIVARLEKDEIGSIRNRFGPCRGKNVFGGNRRRDPHLRNGNSGNEGGEKSGGGGPRQGVRHALTKRTADRLPKRARSARELECKRPFDGAIDHLFGPAIEKGGLVHHPPDAPRPGADGFEDALAFQPAEKPVGQSDRYPRFASKILDVPFSTDVEQDRLRGQPCLSRKSNLTFGHRDPIGFSLRLNAYQESGESKIGISQPIDEPHVVPGQDVSSLYRGSIDHGHKRHPLSLRMPYKFPGLRRPDSSMSEYRDRKSLASGDQETARCVLCLYARDLSQDPESAHIQRALDFH